MPRLREVGQVQAPVKQVPYVFTDNVPAKPQEIYGDSVDPMRCAGHTDGMRLYLLKCEGRGPRQTLLRRSPSLKRVVVQVVCRVESFQNFRP